MVCIIRQPMLSAKPEGGDPASIDAMLRQITYPVLLSPKMDGFRNLNSEGALYSRKVKPIPNAHTNKLFGIPECHGMDGELIVGKPYDENVMQQTSSGVSTRAGEPDVHWYVFDDFSRLDIPFEKRLAGVEKRIKAIAHPSIKFVPHQIAHNRDELLAFDEKCLDRGYEGTMGRSLNGPYKVGRSTLRQGWLFAVKRTVDFEAEIVEVYEKLHNANEATTDERGYTKRSSHKANKHGLDTFGGVICRTREGVLFKAGGGKGLTDVLRAHLWSIRDELPGQWAKLASLPIGVKEKPRHPKFRCADFLCLRPEWDMP